ncbi:MAG: glutamate-cysteine ligase family protein, partial [Pseudomonadota bacterium]
MSTREASGAQDPVIECRDQLVAPMMGGEKPESDWRIGTEHEKLVYKRDDFRASSYDEPCGIRDMLMNLREFGWEPVEENGNVIALKGKDGAVSLEPAGQLELSGAPLKNLHETCAETGRHLEQVKAIGERCGIGFLGLGMWPDKTRDELPVMPKGRYDIMMRHMPKVGNLGLDM